MLQWFDHDKLKGFANKRDDTPTKQQLSSLRFLSFSCVSCCVYSWSLALAHGVLAVVPPYFQSASSLVLPFLVALLPLALLALLILLVAFVSLLYPNVLRCSNRVVGAVVGWLGQKTEKQKEKPQKCRESKGRRQNNRTVKKQRN